MGQSLTHAFTTTYDSTTQRAINLKIYYNSSLAVSDSVNDLDVTGDWPNLTNHSTAISIGSGGGSQLIYDNTVYFTKDNSSKSFAASLTGIEFWGASNVISTNGSVSIPPGLPAAPTGVTATRVSDTQHTVSWTRNATTTAPYSSQRVQRSTDGGSWATVLDVSTYYTTTGSHSWSDMTTSADHSYRYRVIANNSTGSATSAESATVYTTPAAPGTPSAVKSGANIVLSFSNTARHDVGIKVYASQDGGAFALLATVATANLTGYTHTAPSSSVTWAYKVATYNGSLISAQSAASNTVQLLAAPNAPTNLGPTTVRDATENVTLTWQHNPVDTTGQAAFQVQHRAAGAGTWTTETAVTSATSSWVLTGGTYANPTTVEWQVRTKGAHADYSPWSATASLPSSARPTGTISSPADASVVATSELTVSWAYYDAESKAQVAWQVDLLDNLGAVVESLPGVGAGTTATLEATLSDGFAGSARLVVQDADGMWSLGDTNAFTVAYAVPPTPVVVATWDPDTATVGLAITVTDPPTAPEVAATHVNVYRSLDGGAFVLIAEAVPLNTSVTDYSPTVAGTNDYYAVAVSALPSTAQSATVTVTTPEAGDRASLWLSAGPGFSVVCRAVTNISIVSRTGKASKVLHRFAGRDKRVEFASDAAERGWDVSFEVIRDSGRGDSTVAEWLDLGELAGPHLLRSTDHYRYVSVPGVTAAADVGGMVTGVSFTAEESDDA